MKGSKHVNTHARSGTQNKKVQADLRVRLVAAGLLQRGEQRLRLNRCERCLLKDVYTSIQYERQILHGEPVAGAQLALLRGAERLGAVDVQRVQNAPEDQRELLRGHFVDNGRRFPQPTGHCEAFHTVVPSLLVFCSQRKAQVSVLACFRVGGCYRLMRSMFRGR